MAKLIIKEGDRKRIYEICEDTLHIGSTPENNIRLRDPGVSRVHCEIKKTQQGYRIIDLESKRGTKVNGEFINQHPLRHGDRIQIGNALLQFNAGSSTARAAVEARESVRMERARTRKGLHPAAVVAICLAVLALIIIILTQANLFERDKGLEILRPVAEYLNSTDRNILQKAADKLAEYEALPEHEKTTFSRQRFANYTKLLKEKLFTLTMEDRLRNEKKDYFSMSNDAYHLAHKGDYTGAMALADQFDQKYPDSVWTKEWNKKRKRWIEKLEGEVGDIPKTLAAIDQHINNEEFGKANHLVNLLARRARQPQNQKRLAELDKKLQSTIKTLWKRRHKEAQEYADEYNYRVAKEIYTDIKQKWGWQSFADMADAEIKKLELREK